MSPSWIKQWELRFKKIKLSKGEREKLGICLKAYSYLSFHAVGTSFRIGVGHQTKVRSLKRRRNAFRRSWGIRGGISVGVVAFVG